MNNPNPHSIDAYTSVRTISTPSGAPNPGQPRKRFDDDALQALFDRFLLRASHLPMIVSDSPPTCPGTHAE